MCTDGGSCERQSCKGEKTAGQRSRLVISKMKCAWAHLSLLQPNSSFQKYRDSQTIPVGWITIVLSKRNCSSIVQREKYRYCTISTIGSRPVMRYGHSSLGRSSRGGVMRNLQLSSRILGSVRNFLTFWQGTFVLVDVRRGA
jgi:hypothetical protein